MKVACIPVNIIIKKQWIVWTMYCYVTFTIFSFYIFLIKTVVTLYKCKYFSARSLFPHANFNTDKIKFSYESKLFDVVLYISSYREVDCDVKVQLHPAPDIIQQRVVAIHSRQTHTWLLFFLIWHVIMYEKFRECNMIVQF